MGLHGLAIGCRVGIGRANEEISTAGTLSHLTDHGVTNIVDDTVSVIDTATRNAINTIKAGEGPNGITFKSASR